MQSNLEIKMADQNICYSATQMKKKYGVIELGGI